MLMWKDTDSEPEELKIQSFSKYLINDESSMDEDNRAAKKVSMRSTEILRSGNESDSSKEFQKSKLMRDDYNYTRHNMQKCTKMNTSKERGKGTGHNDKQQSKHFKSQFLHILNECKHVCSVYEAHMERLRQKCSKADVIHVENANRIVHKSNSIINKLKDALDKQSKNLITFHTSWSEDYRARNSLEKKTSKGSNSETSASDTEAQKKNHESKSASTITNVRSSTEKIISDCDSEIIFSGDEMSKSLESKDRTNNKRLRKKRKHILSDIDTSDEEIIIEKHVGQGDTDESCHRASPILITSKEKKTTSERIKGNSRKTTINEEVDENVTEELIGKSTKMTNQDQTSFEEKDDQVNMQHNSKEGTTLSSDTFDANFKDEMNNSLNDIFESSFDLIDMTDKLDLQTEEEDNSTKIDTPISATTCVKAKYNETTTKNKDIKTRYINVNVENEMDDVINVDIEDQHENSNQDAASTCQKEKKIMQEQAMHENNQCITTNDNVDKLINTTEFQEEKDDDMDTYLTDMEELAKKTMLESSSEASDTQENLIESSPTVILEPMEHTSVEHNEHNEHNDSSDIDSSGSTVLLHNLDELKTCNEKNRSEKAKTKSTSKTNCSEEKSASVVQETEEEIAKQTLLDLNSDDSVVLPPDNMVANNNEKTLTTLDKENLQAKQALLISSNSESCNSDQESKPHNSTLITSKTNTHDKKLSLKRNYDSESDNSVGSRVKRRRLKLTKNPHYTTDKKLRMRCRVHIIRLEQKVVNRYKRALEKSRQYQEDNAIKSLINLGKLERKHKKSFDIDASEENKLSMSSKDKHRKKGQTDKVVQDSLMDHLKKIENGEIPNLDESPCNDNINSLTEIHSAFLTNEDLTSEADRVAKSILLHSSDSNGEMELELGNSNDGKSADSAKKKNERKELIKKKTGKTDQQSTSEEEDKEKKREKGRWKKKKLLTMKFSDSDSEKEKEKWNKSQEKQEMKEENEDDSDCNVKAHGKKKQRLRRIINSDSDSDIKITDCEPDTDDSMASSEKNSSNSDSKKGKLKKRGRKKANCKLSDTDTSSSEKRQKPKRKRIKKIASDSDSSDAVVNSQGTSNKSGRKNIRKVLKDKQVAEDTKQAAKEEEERLKRIAERQKWYNEMYEARLAGEEKVEKLVLDFDPETKEELISVHKDLVKRLKPHQAQGIKFMWDACFESMERLKTTTGSGCIIAHCMGLGKTLQVISLVHTLLTHEATAVKTVMIVCPLSTVLNWINEFDIWLKDVDNGDIELYEMTKLKKNFERKYQLQSWQKTGGVLVIGYEMFRNLCGSNKNMRKAMKETILECLLDPGPDLIVCDEGHLLKNEDTALSKCMKRVKTLRRIVLTGTPLQNNLIEYHCMVQFVKPNLLGTKKEFLNRFVNPITNGQFDDSTAYDVKLMKKRAHVLHKMLEGSVQRFNYSVLTPFLPPKQEYVIFVRLTDVQIKMYQHYLANFARRHTGAGGSLFADFQALQRIWTHPIVLRLNAEKVEKANEKRLLSSDTEGSLKDFIDDSSESSTTTSVSSTSSSSSDSDSDVQCMQDSNKASSTKRKTRNNPGDDEIKEEEPEKPNEEKDWWSQFVQDNDFKDMRISAKLMLLFGILKECEEIGDKVLVFSQSLYSLTLIEDFLGQIDDETQKGTKSEFLDEHTGSWSLGLDYFRLDGQTSAENRNIWCKIFNKPTNTRARLFLISTRAGGLGINLTAANRVVIFDASWNPSHDVQSIFRVYRFGQKKACYVYRFLASGTMEEKIYNRQVTKLSLSCRVVDEQQIERHYSNNDLAELYKFEEYTDPENRPTLNLPKDRLLAEILLKYKSFIENYHEHDSLLENKAEEELDEEERKQAWIEYEEEKKGKPLQPPPMMTSYQNNMLMQQYNMMMNIDRTNVPQTVPTQIDYENLQQLIQKDYPNATPEQQKMITTRALLDMYTYWEKQAIVQSKRNMMMQPGLMAPVTGANISSYVPYTAQQKPIMRQQPQLQQQQQRNEQQMSYPSQIHKGYTTLGSSTFNTTNLAEDDIVEVPTTVNPVVSTTQGYVQSTSKNQEE